MATDLDTIATHAAMNATSDTVSRWMRRCSTNAQPKQDDDTRATALPCAEGARQSGSTPLGREWQCLIDAGARVHAVIIAVVLT